MADHVCKTVIAPIIHHNGDRAETLMDALEQAYKALRAAEQALQATHPNARNYYPVDGLFPQARQQYERRMHSLHSLQKELLAEYRAIEHQQR